MIGGFLGCGTPERLIRFLISLNLKNLVIITNDTAFPEVGIGKLISKKECVQKIICSHIGTNPHTIQRVVDGTLKVEFFPQGTLAEKIRAQGYGLGGFLTPTGVGTVAAENKQILTLNGKDYILELPIKADIALIRGSICDSFGNIIYNATARNFNPLMAMAADITICEADQIVKIGEIDQNRIETSGIFINHIVSHGDELN